MGQAAHSGSQCVRQSEAFLTSYGLKRRAPGDPGVPVADPDLTGGDHGLPPRDQASCSAAHGSTTAFSLSVSVCARPSGPRTVACHLPGGQPADIRH